MAAADTTDLRSQTDDRLRESLEESHQALFNLRFQAATGQLAQVAEVRRARRRIARIKTLLREREILQAADAASAAAADAPTDERED